MDFLLQVFLFLLCFDDRFSFPVLLNGLSDKRSKEDHLICQKLSKSFTHDFCRRGISTFQMRDNPEVKTLQPCPEKQQGRRLWKLITIHINKLNKLIWKNLLKIVSLFDFWTSLSWSLPSSFIPCIILQSQPDVNDQRSSAFSDPSPFLADKMCQLRLKSFFYGRDSKFCTILVLYLAAPGDTVPWVDERVFSIWMFQ